MKLLADLSMDEITQLIADLGHPAFRAKQLFSWIAAGALYSQMSNIPLSLRTTLAQEYADTAAQIITVSASSDGSEKYLYALADGETVEGVFLPNRYGNTLCVSTQAGCRMACAFCASGAHGLSRNLSAGEMLGQFIAAGKRHTLTQGKSRTISNVVLMGSGEPLDNYENSVKFIRLLSAPEGLNVSTRNISLSTCGIAPQIRRLADEGLGITLSLSLHAAVEDTRKKLMPIAKKFPLAEVLSAATYYFNKTGRRVIFEYALISGVNDSDADAQALRTLTKGLSCHVNLIRLNRVENSPYKGSTQAAADAFLKKLTDLTVSASLRRSYGKDVGAACGQLRAQARNCPQ
ncbi:MAG: 23S rRNA (adenine(2503)-C(2))-methyltransferase RlmN [Firmicutes bacterium]|nr:23S rRNA (adenine(2503)-C(2))-methyltransferase RlmN [Bacillota bacterium]